MMREGAILMKSLSLLRNHQQGLQIDTLEVKWALKRQPSGPLLQRSNHNARLHFVFDDKVGQEFGFSQTQSQGSFWQTQGRQSDNWNIDFVTTNDNSSTCQI